MKTILLTLSLALAFMTSSSLADHHKKTPGAYRHVVCFKFKDDASKDQVTAIEKAFAELSTKIDAITDYEWGTNVSPENHAILDKVFVIDFVAK